MWEYNGIIKQKYTIDILLYLYEEGECPQSRFNHLRGEYNLVLDRVQELVELGFIKKIDPGKWGSVKGIYRLTEDGEVLAEELERVENLAQDLAKDEE